MFLADNLTRPILDTTTVDATSRVVVFHSSPNVNTEYDIAITAIICGTILLCLLIGFFTLGYCFNKAQKERAVEINARNEFEKFKFEKECAWKTRKERYESAWRTIEHYWKEKKDSGTSDNGAKETEKDKAWEYIKYFWNTEMSESAIYDK